MNLMTDSLFLKRMIMSMAKYIVELEDTDLTTQITEDEEKTLIEETIQEHHDNVVKSLESKVIDCPAGMEASVKIAKELYNLQCGESIDLTNFSEIERVPGGWLYSGTTRSSTFIPYNNEFESLRYYKIKEAQK